MQNAFTKKSYAIIKALGLRLHFRVVRENLCKEELGVN